MIRIVHLSICNLFILLFFSSLSLSEIVKKFKISGNERISDESVIMFSNLNVGDDLSKKNINEILKNLYDTNFFENVSLSFDNGVVSVNIDEAPLIQDIIVNGLSANKFEDLIKKNRILKPKSSYNKFLLSEEIELFKSLFKSQGFYFVKIEVSVDQLDNNLVNILYDIDIGDKSKISKISFIGDKIYKNKKLQSIIVSEEYKFWKFISGKKYLQEELINLDTRLLKNFYLNKGFYNAEINSSFAKLVNSDEFELIFNIDPGNKFYFGDLNIILPVDFDRNNYIDLEMLMNNLKNEPYSINSVNKILDEIDKITILDEFKTINASINEVIVDDKLNIDFLIKESDKFFVEKINIFGNNVTRENVIRNKLQIDEGDPYSDLLLKKTENNIKSLNFFKNVKTKVVDGIDENSKIINIEIEEKPTGEIMAGAGVGTSGGTASFGVKENNYLGKGLAVEANATGTADSFKGLFSVTNPNFKNTDKSFYINLQAIEIDQLKKFGYKTKKNGFEVGTSFEYLDDFYLGLSTSTFVENIETSSNASARQKKQTGNYLDTFLNFNFTYDKRNQKFRPSDGYVSNYNIKTPIISENNTLTNSYSYKSYLEFFDNNIFSFSFLAKNATSLTGDDVKLTERLSIPSKRLRGFESGKVGPKDGGDFIGGNYLAAINLQSSIPGLFSNSQSLDAIIFLDTANIWGIDYDSSLDDGDKIRSSIGFGIDWMTVVGPVNFSLSEVISKQDSDIEETFRFNLGTTF